MNSGKTSKTLSQPVGISEFSPPAWGWSAILNETTELVCFRLQGNNGLECLAVLGVDVAEVSNLALGAFVARDVKTGGERRGKVF